MKHVLCGFWAPVGFLLLSLLLFVFPSVLFAEVTYGDIVKWGLLRKQDIPAIISGTNAPASNPGYVRLYDSGNNQWIRISMTNGVIIIQQEITE